VTHQINGRVLLRQFGNVNFRCIDVKIYGVDFNEQERFIGYPSINIASYLDRAQQVSNVDDYRYLNEYRHLNDIPPKTFVHAKYQIQPDLLLVLDEQGQMTQTYGLTHAFGEFYSIPVDLSGQALNYQFAQLGEVESSILASFDIFLPNRNLPLLQVKEVNLERFAAVSQPMAFINKHLTMWNLSFNTLHYLERFFGDIWCRHELDAALDEILKLAAYSAMQGCGRKDYKVQRFYFLGRGSFDWKVPKAYMHQPLKMELTVVIDGEEQSRHHLKTYLGHAGYAGHYSGAFAQWDYKAKYKMKVYCDHPHHEFKIDRTRFEEVSLSIQLGNQWIPLLSRTFQKHQLSFGWEHLQFQTAAPKSSKFYMALPEHVSRYDIQYCDMRLGHDGSEGVWREFHDTFLKGNLLIFPNTALSPGHYPFRLKLWDAQGNPIALSEHGHVDEEGWYIGLFSHRSESQGFITHPANNYYEPVHPTWSQSYDRWGNILQVTDELGASTEFTYNYGNQVLQKISPEVEVMFSNGHVEFHHHRNLCL
jgi:hypothetical protein